MRRKFLRYGVSQILLTTLVIGLVVYYFTAQINVEVYELPQVVSINGVDDILCNYKPGEPTMKPDVLQQMVEIEETRRKHMENIASKHQQEGQIMVTNNTGESKALNNQQVVSIIREQQGKLKEYEAKLNDANRQFQEMNIKIQQQHGIIQHLQTQNKEYVDQIMELKLELKSKNKQANSSDSNIVNSENLELKINM